MFTINRTKFCLMAFNSNRSKIFQLQWSNYACIVHIIGMLFLLARQKKNLVIFLEKVFLKYISNPLIHQGIHPRMFFFQPKTPFIFLLYLHRCSSLMSHYYHNQTTFIVSLCTNAFTTAFFQSDGLLVPVYSCAVILVWVK